MSFKIEMQSLFMSNYEYSQLMLNGYNISLYLFMYVLFIYFGQSSVKKFHPIMLSGYIPFLFPKQEDEILCISAKSNLL